ncbi:MAG: hypothetical protein IKF49_04975 [Clostridia bacterium]|nr:hypothetical protein [Clostridia bacterium]
MSTNGKEIVIVDINKNATRNVGRALQREAGTHPTDSGIFIDIKSLNQTMSILHIFRTVKSNILFTIQNNNEKAEDRGSLKKRAFRPDSRN